MVTGGESATPSPSPRSSSKPSPVTAKPKTIGRKAAKTSRKPKPAKPKRPRGRPSVWAARDPKTGRSALEVKIAAFIEATGCSVRDAAELCCVAYSTVKLRAQESDDFSAHLGKSIVRRKVGTLGNIAAQADAGSLRAQIWYMERRHADEWGGFGGRYSDVFDRLDDVGQPTSESDEEMAAILRADRPAYDQILLAIDRRRGGS